MSQQQQPLLDVRGLTVRHGGVTALDQVDIAVPAHTIAGLIGPNGAGKTTFIDALSGFKDASHGRIDFDCQRFDSLPAHARSRQGMVRTFQSLELFDDLTVRENLAVAAAAPTWRSTVTDLFRVKAPTDHGIDDLLDSLDLTPWADRLPTELSNGQRHLVALARAMMASPKLVLLDEPAAGLDTTETTELAVALRTLPGLGTTVLLVDHDMSLVMAVCDTIHVLDFGRIIASGAPTQVRQDPTVIAAYLGTQEHPA